MFSNYAKYRIQLKNQRKRANELRRSCPDDNPHAREDGTLQNYFNQVEISEQWLSLIQTEYFTAEARRLLVPVPEYGEEGMYLRVAWDDHPDEPYYLTAPGLKILKSAVREEKKHRREIAAFWMTSLTGLIGATIGLITIISKI